MAAADNRTDSIQTIDSLKNLRNFTAPRARQLAQSVQTSRAQLEEMERLLRQKKADFDVQFIEQRQAEEQAEQQVEVPLPSAEPVIEAQQQVEQVVEEVAPPVEVQEQPSVKPTPVTEQPTEVQPVKQEVEIKPQPVAEEIAKVPTTPKQPTPQKQSEKVAAPQEKPAPPAEQPQQKPATYTDEKGNVKVRRFLEPQPTFNRQKTSPNTHPQQPRQPRTGNQGDSSYQRNNTSPRMQGQQTSQQGQRPLSPSQRPMAKKPGSAMPAPVSMPPKEGKSFGNKKKSHDKPDDAKAANKRSLITRTFSQSAEDEDRVKRSRPRSKKADTPTTVVIKKIEKAVVTTEEVPIKVLSEKIGKTATEIIKELFKDGITKRINDSIDYEYAQYVASNFGVELEYKPDVTAEEEITNVAEADSLPDNVKRPPIVTVMGHVDHGKTSLLDAIRKTNVTSGEAGGITQHIGAYTVMIKGEQITFIDTPGHAAFTKMRARGAKVTDVAIIVVAADDGVMPQTIEAISHAKAAEVSIIVAINKMDREGANPEFVKRQLIEQGLLAEEWGGDVIMVPVSAKTGMGIEELLESVLTVAEVKELRANPDKKATGTVIESQLDKGRGPVATILVRNGTLHVGDSIIAGTATGRIRAMFDDRGGKITAAPPSCPVEVLGFSNVPNAGDYVYVADEKLVRKVAEERKTKVKIETAKATATISLDDLYSKISEGSMKVLNVIIKTDVQGSLDALKLAISKISNDEVTVMPLHGGVGAINETDVMLAKASNAIIIGFNVRADSSAKVNAEAEKVDIRQYRVIYDAVDDITKAMKGMLAPKYREVILGQVQVREVFKISNVGTVAGCYVTSGKINRSAKVRVYRNDVLIHDGQLLALKRFKDDVKEVAQGYECGISLDGYNDIKLDDVFEAYTMEVMEQ